MYIDRICFDYLWKNLPRFSEPARWVAQKPIPQCQLLESRPAPCKHCWKSRRHWGVWRWMSGWGWARRRSGQTLASKPCTDMSLGEYRWGSIRQQVHILVWKIHHHMLHDSVLNWLRKYLYNRWHYVSIESTNLNECQLVMVLRKVWFLLVVVFVLFTWIVWIFS